MTKELLPSVAPFRSSFNPYLLLFIRLAQRHATSLAAFSSSFVILSSSAYSITLVDIDMAHYL